MLLDQHDRARDLPGRDLMAHEVADRPKVRSRKTSGIACRSFFKLTARDSERGDERA